MPIIQHLIVDEFGVHVSKHSERLQVMRLGEGTPSERMVQRAPLLHLESVLITGRGISLSADAIEACCRRGIPIHFVSGRGQPYAALYSAGLTGTVQTRRAQMLAYSDQRSLALARAFAKGKVHNQAALLRYMAKYRKEADPELHDQLRRASEEVEAHLEELDRLEGSCVDDVRGQVLSAEGRAAQRYWEAIKLVFASTFFDDVARYMHTHSIPRDDEEMAVALETVVGTEHGQVYYPLAAGVCQSLTIFRWARCSPPTAW